MTTDKPEPMMSVEKAIVAIETIEVFHKTSDLCSEALPRVVDLIRSLDERARKAERNFEQAAACHKEALGWYNEAKAQVAEQAKEIERLNSSCAGTMTDQIKPEPVEQRICRMSCDKGGVAYVVWPSNITKDDAEDIIAIFEILGRTLRRSTQEKGREMLEPKNWDEPREPVTDHAFLAGNRLAGCEFITSSGRDHNGSYTEFCGESPERHQSGGGAA